jgi:hypothetical protein
MHVVIVSDIFNILLIVFIDFNKINRFIINIKEWLKKCNNSMMTEPDC